MNTLSRTTPYLLSASLPLAIFAWFVPAGGSEIDLWLMWLVAMVLIGLPILYTEFALARRSGKGVWQGMQTLTREADTKVYWRVFAGLSVFVSVLLSALMVSSFSTWLTSGADNAMLKLSIPATAVSGVLMVVVMILSLLKQRALGLGSVLVIFGAVLAVLMGRLTMPIMTATNLSEWGVAVVLALFCMGSGTGLFWFFASQDIKFQEKLNDKEHKINKLSTMVLPIWLAQTVFGVFGLIVASSERPAIASLVGGVGVVLFGAYLLYYAFGQAIVRFGMINGVLGVAVLSLVMAVLPLSVLKLLLVLIGLSAVLVLSVFVGWLMKISHLRKALNFGSEARYNLWRVAMRFVVPIAIVLALVGMLMGGL